MSTVVSAQQILATVPKHEQRRAQVNGSTTPTPPAAPTVDQILATAEASHVARTRRTAARIRQQVDALRDQLKTETREGVARARIADLRRQLDEANAALRRIQSAGTSSHKTGDSLSRTWQVRQWAAANEVTCPAFGRIPKTVMAAYLAAKGGTP